MKKTPLYSQHLSLQAKLVPFGGWEMPVSYSGILNEQEAVRKRAGIFDISHMGEIFIEGEEAFQFVDFLTCNDPSKLKDGDCQYTLFLNPKGGVIDDVILYRLNSQKYLFCVNASNIDKDYDWIISHSKKFKVEARNESEKWGLIAIQGPRSVQLLSQIVSDLSFGSFSFRIQKIQETETLLSRTGYTGEDGFEWFIPASILESVWKQLIELSSLVEAVPCGLGCRDILRLEMGYPLYGQELTDEITPFEAGLSWVVKMKKGGFIGRDSLELQEKNGILKKRVGFIMDGRGIPRTGYPIFHHEKKVGLVTSGTYSPSLDKSIGCGYVPVTLAALGSEVEVEIREKLHKAKIVSFPFYK